MCISLTNFQFLCLSLFDHLSQSSFFAESKPNKSDLSRGELYETGQLWILGVRWCRQCCFIAIHLVLKCGSGPNEM